MATEVERPTPMLPLGEGWRYIEALESAEQVRPTIAKTFREKAPVTGAIAQSPSEIFIREAFEWTGTHVRPDRPNAPAYGQMIDIFSPLAYLAPLESFIRAYFTKNNEDGFWDRLEGYKTQILEALYKQELGIEEAEEEGEERIKISPKEFLEIAYFTPESIDYSKIDIGFPLDEDGLRRLVEEYRRVKEGEKREKRELKEAVENLKEYVDKKINEVRGYLEERTRTQPFYPVYALGGVSQDHLEEIRNYLNEMGKGFEENPDAALYANLIVSTYIMTLLSETLKEYTKGRSDYDNTVKNAVETLKEVVEIIRKK